jgi:IS66 C-terminal element
VRLAGHPPLGRRSTPGRASTPARSSPRRRASALHAPTHPKRDARSECDALSVRTADASDIGPRHPARYGQNDREIALNRKNALFAGHDEGAENWACIASLVETCKLHGVDPQTYFTDVLTKLVNLWPASRLDELMPWNWAAEHSANALAA